MENDRSTEELKEELKKTSEELRREAESEARSLTEQAKEKARSFADEKKDFLADELEGVSSALGDAAGTLEKETGLPVDQYVRSAAQGLREMSSNIRSSSSTDGLKKLEDLTRERPLEVVAAATVLGFLVARFLRSSAR